MKRKFPQTKSKSDLNLFLFEKILLYYFWAYKLSKAVIIFYVLIQTKVCLTHCYHKTWSYRYWLHSLVQKTIKQLKQFNETSCQFQLTTWPSSASPKPTQCIIPYQPTVTIQRCKFYFRHHRLNPGPSSSPPAAPQISRSHIFLLSPQSNERKCNAKRALDIRQTHTVEREREKRTKQKESDGEFILYLFEQYLRARHDVDGYLCLCLGCGKAANDWCLKKHSFKFKLRWVIWQAGDGNYEGNVSLAFSSCSQKCLGKHVWGLRGMRTN